MYLIFIKYVFIIYVLSLFIFIKTELKQDRLYSNDKQIPAFSLAKTDSTKTTLNRITTPINKKEQRLATSLSKNALTANSITKKDTSFDFKLYIGVRYFAGEDPEKVGAFDFKISIDNHLVVDDYYPKSFDENSLGPDYIILQLSKGKHTIKVSSQKANRTNFTTSFVMKDKNYFAQINYDYYPKQHVNYKMRGFEFLIQEKEFGWR